MLNTLKTSAYYSNVMAFNDHCGDDKISLQCILFSSILLFLYLVIIASVKQRIIEIVPVITLRYKMSERMTLYRLDLDQFIDNDMVLYLKEMTSYPPFAKCFKININGSYFCQRLR